MSAKSKLDGVLGLAWPSLLDRLDEGVMVVDQDRRVRFLNQRASRLLGVVADEVVGRRCCDTTRGVDCDGACPMTYATQEGLDLVDGFAATYRTACGEELPVRVTAMPLRDAAGELAGHVEVFRPREPETGFYLAGSSAVAVALRGRLRELARSGDHVLLVGDESCCSDVARALHRFAGGPKDTFVPWPGAWARVRSWPPGTVYATGEAVDPVLKETPQPGWRVVAAVPDQHVGNGCALEPLAVVELPSPAARGDDLPLMLAARVDQMAPGLQVAAGALQRLCRMTVELGYDGVQRVLDVAVAAARDLLDDTHLPRDCYGAALVDEALRCDKPMAALEARLVREVLERCGWRMQEAADRLGISRVTLWRKVKEHGIERA